VNRNESDTPPVRRIAVLQRVATLCLMGAHWGAACAVRACRKLWFPVFSCKPQSHPNCW